MDKLKASHECNMGFEAAHDRECLVYQSLNAHGMERIVKRARLADVVIPSPRTLTE